MYKTLRLVGISLLINVLNKGVLLFFWGKLFYKSNRKLFSCVCISWYKHSRSWENSRQLCKPSTSSRVCITVSNSPNPSRVYIRLCKHGKRFLLLNYKITKIVRALWLAERSVCIRVCKHGCDVKMFYFSRANHASMNFLSSKFDKFTLFTHSFVGWNLENLYRQAVQVSFDVINSRVHLSFGLSFLSL